MGCAFGWLSQSSRPLFASAGSDAGGERRMPLQNVEEKKASGKRWVESGDGTLTGGDGRLTLIGLHVGESGCC